MKTTVLQTVGIAYYEFRMLWRERAQVVITLVLLLMALIPSLLATNDVNGISSGDSFEIQGHILEMTQIVVLILWGPVGVSMAILAPIFLADMIAKDRQLGVCELIDTTSLSRASYILGKLLGGWLAMLTSLLLVMLVSAALWVLRVGSLDLSFYLDMWLLGGLSLVLINGGLGMLLPALQPTRRRAILLMVGLAIIGFLFSGLDAEANIFSPLRGPIILYYMDTSGVAARDSFFATIAVGFIQLAIVALGLWGWMRWRAAQR